MKKFALGIDIGGTKTAVCIADKSLKIIDSISFPTMSENGAEALVKKITQNVGKMCVKNCISQKDVIFAGLACPGPLDVKRGRIIHIATMGFKDVPIKAMVEEALGIPVFLENDANLAALGEFHFANLTDNDTFIYITVSTGIGCGVIKNGKILTEDLFDTELGHYNVVVDGKFCPCGKMGCLELYSSGTAIANDVSVLLNKNCDTKTAFSLARAGEVRVLKIINTATDKLALAINKLCYELNPKYIVLGGGVTKDSDVFLPRLKEKVLHKCDIKISSLDGKQGMLGAVVFGIQNYEGKW